MVFNIESAVSEIIETLADKVAMKNIFIKTQYNGFDGPEKNLIKTDQKRMQQILLNIYNNAIKFTDRNGHITLLIEKVDNHSEKKLVISVIDSGIGIKKKN